MGDTVKDANKQNDQHECDIRDLGKKIQTYEVDFDETNDKLTKVNLSYEEKEKEFKNAEEDVGALSRRVMLMEEEAKKADTALAETVTKLAMMSKDADAILKKVKYFENKTMNNEMELEEGDKNLMRSQESLEYKRMKANELPRELNWQKENSRM